MVEQPTTTLRTPVCDILGCDYPVVLAGMGGVARSELVIAVIEAGAYGFLGMVREPPHLIRAEIRRVRSATSRNFGVNVIPAATAPDLLTAQIEVLVEEQVAAVALFWDLHANIVKRLTDAGRLVVCQVGSANEAELAVAAGARVVVAQGFEAGGHVRGRTRLMTLVP
jgi:nitronate monooxygenase